MTPDDETIMAYADGQLDPLAAKRVERALADDPALAARLANERALRDRLAKAFAPVAAAPVPATLTDGLRTNVARLPPPPTRQRRWAEIAAIAATLVLGVAIGRTAPDAPVAVARDGLVARGGLRSALDGTLSGGTGPTRLVASFRAVDHRYCRVFAMPAIDGIACRDDDGWAIVRTQSARRAPSTAYAQAAAPAAQVMAAAQDMMAGQPLDRPAERAVRDRHWR